MGQVELPIKFSYMTNMTSLLKYTLNLESIQALLPKTIIKHEICPCHNLHTCTGKSLKLC